MESIIKWSGSITCKLVHRHKRQTPHTECSCLGCQLSYSVAMNLEGGNWNECPLPFSKPTAFFCSRNPFICTVHPYFIRTGMTGERRGERRTFYSLVLLRIAGQFYCTTVQTQPQGKAGRNHRECSHFSEHIRFPSLLCLCWVSHGDESSYKLTPLELLKSKKIVGYTSARHKIQYFVLPCLGVLRLCQKPLQSESLRTGEK